jgi:hypothetical protein
MIKSLRKQTCQLEGKKRKEKYYEEQVDLESTTQDGIQLFRRPRNCIDILESFDQHTPDARQTRLSCILTRKDVSVLLHDLLSVACIRRSERMVETAEDEVRRLRRRMRSDEMQFPLNGGAEVVEIEIIQIVVEWVFNFLTDLEESQEEERREGSTIQPN